MVAAKTNTHTRRLTDDGGDATDTYAYDAWGNEVALSGTTVNRFRWVGRVGYYYDGGLGTFYIPARVYEPVAGAWISVDPIGFEAGCWIMNGMTPLPNLGPSQVQRGPRSSNRDRIKLGGEDKRGAGL